MKVRVDERLKGGRDSQALLQMEAGGHERSGDSNIRAVCVTGHRD